MPTHKNCCSVSAAVALSIGGTYNPISGGLLVNPDSDTSHSPQLTKQTIGDYSSECAVEECTYVSRTLYKFPLIDTSFLGYIMGRQLLNLHDIILRTVISETATRRTVISE